MEMKQAQDSGNGLAEEMFQSPNKIKKHNNTISNTPHQSNIKPQQIHYPQTDIKIPINSQMNQTNTNKLSNRKKVEDHFLKILNIFSNNNKIIINTLTKHIWRTCTELEKEIDKTYSASQKDKDKEQLSISTFRKYIIDLDSALISFTSLINAFPGLISIILKYHKQKQKISFISFLIRSICFV